MGNWDMSWDCNGSKMVGELEEIMGSPEKMAEDLDYYRTYLGGNFSKEMLIELYKARALARLAAAVYDLPEFMSEQFFRAFNSGQVIKVESTIGNEISGSITVYQE